MSVITRIYLITLVSLVACQDYQDYENAPRSAPVRLRAGGGAVSQADVRPTPVPILKQINKHNEDGSYTYGYEGADGSFKIETKLATGEVKGKYGYVDEAGKVRVVEYGANKYGFQPSGDGITVAPPTLVDETTNRENLADYEDEPQRPPRPSYAVRPNRPQPQPRPAPPPPQPPRPQYADYEQELEQEPPRRHQFAPAPVAGPSPARLQITGAHPVGVQYSDDQRPARPDAEYSQSQSFGGGPANVRISRPVYAQSPPPAVLQQFQTRPQTFDPQPQQQQQQQQQQQLRPEQLEYQPQNRPAPQALRYPVQSAPQGRSTSVLDQLAKDYALPQGGAQPLHDITFGYY